MLRFHTLFYRLIPKFHNFNTSNVTVPFIVSATVSTIGRFQYIQCYGSIIFSTKSPIPWSIFQYIQCYGSINHVVETWQQAWEFQYIQCYGSIFNPVIEYLFVYQISIHPMLRFHSYSSCVLAFVNFNFNTSNVTVPLFILGIMWYIAIYFNTSNVTVPCDEAIIILFLNLISIHPMLRFHLSFFLLLVHCILISIHPMLRFHL